MCNYCCTNDAEPCAMQYTEECECFIKGEKDGKSKI